MALLVSQEEDENVAPKAHIASRTPHFHTSDAFSNLTFVEHFPSQFAKFKDSEKTIV
jgi:hypothetical protein